jgi:hypothetical protein
MHSDGVRLEVHTASAGDEVRDNGLKHQNENGRQPAAGAVVPASLRTSDGLAGVRLAFFQVALPHE